MHCCPSSDHRGLLAICSRTSISLLTTVALYAIAADAIATDATITVTHATHQDESIPAVTAVGIQASGPSGETGHI